VVDDLQDTLSRLLGGLGLDLVDLERGHGLLRVTIDRPGGIDLDALAEANRALSAALDEIDPMPGRYTLEVSSPGVERRLRTPEQFTRAIGEIVSVRTIGGLEGQRRVQGRLVAADETGIVIDGTEVPGGTVRVAYGSIERARTVFEWGASPAPSPSRRSPAKRGANAKDPKKRSPRAPAPAPGVDGAATERVTTP